MHSHAVSHPGTPEQHLGFFSVQHATSIKPLFSNSHEALLLTNLDQGLTDFSDLKASHCINDFAHQTNSVLPAYSIHTANLAYWWLSFERYPLPTVSTFATRIASNSSITFRPQFFNYSRTQTVTSTLVNSPLALSFSRSITATTSLHKLNNTR